MHSSPGLEIGVYVLVAPEPDRQQPHDEDEVYVVLEGSGVLEVEGTATALTEGMALFVPAGAEHRFTAYEQLSLLVVFNGPAFGLIEAQRPTPRCRRQVYCCECKYELTPRAMTFKRARTPHYDDPGGRRQARCSRRARPQA